MSDVDLCTKCLTKNTSHKSGRCQSCRKSTCPMCKRVGFYDNEFCTKCLNKRGSQAYWERRGAKDDRERIK